jgi:hypothetical protein
MGVDHTDIVAAVKAELERRGVNLSGPCGAFAITKRVAWALRGEGAGLLSKPAGNNCEGYSVDYIVYPDGSSADILTDAGGANSPSWGSNPPDTDFIGRYRPAVDPGDSPPPPPPPPPPGDTSWAEAKAYFVDLQMKMDALRGQQISNMEKIQQQIDQVLKKIDQLAR